MADVALDPTISSWIQTGGVVAFAGLVWNELRQLRPMLREWLEQLNEVKRVLSMMLERERMRAEQREKLLQLNQQWFGGVPESDPAWDLDNTGAVELPFERPPTKRPKTNPIGVPSGEYSVHRKPGGK